MKIFKELRTSTNKTYLVIYYDEQEKWIYNNWIGYVSAENKKEGSLAVVEALKHYNTPFGLNSNQELVGRWDHTLNWIADEWIPMASVAGLQYYAHVVKQEALAASCATDMAQQAEGKFNMRLFDNWHDATDWLKSCKSLVYN